MKTSETIKEIATAMSKAQREMRPASKDSTNPHFRSKYSDLASVMDSIREPLGSNGLSVWQDATTEEMGVSIVTRIVHVSGEWVEFGPFVVPLGKKDAHGIGSACSYGKRYALCAALGVVSDDDDDGNKAVESTKFATVKAKKVEPKKEEIVVHQGESNEVRINESLSSDQAQELTLILKECHPDYSNNLWNYLNNVGINDLRQLKAKNFEEYKEKAIKNRDIYMTGGIS